MALGDLYKPKGLALETAREVLQVDNPYAVNVALGCTGCTYCYGPRAFHKPDWKDIRYPKLFQKDITEVTGNDIRDIYFHYYKQLEKLKEKKDYPDGVFFSFGTDPITGKRRYITSRIITTLREIDCRLSGKETNQKDIFITEKNIKYAILSKTGLITTDYMGMSIVSLSKIFHQTYEPNTLEPIKRLNLLKTYNDDHNGKTWVSMEPYPVPSICEQDLEFLLNEMHFVDFIIFGKWNYDPRTSTPEARAFYAKIVPEFIDYCESHGIRYHVKSDTLKFIGWDAAAMTYEFIENHQRRIK